MPSRGVGAAQLEKAVSEGRFAELARDIGGAQLEDLAGAWPGLKPMTKLAVFKLLSADRAVEFYELLPFSEKYFVFSGFYPASIAPLLENLPASPKKIFTELPRWYYERMLDLLLREMGRAEPAQASGNAG